MSRPTVRYLGVVLVVCGLVLTLSGVGAFSTVTADRQVFVGVGEKSTSYLGISLFETTVITNETNGTNDTQAGGMDTARFDGAQAGRSTVVLGSVTNHFPATLTSIEVTVSKDELGPPTVLGVHVEDVPLKSGSSTGLLATIDCGGVSRGTEMVTIEFEATGVDTYVTGTRTVPVTCANETLSKQPAASNPPQLLSSPRQITTGST